MGSLRLVIGIDPGRMNAFFSGLLDARIDQLPQTTGNFRYLDHNWEYYGNYTLVLEEAITGLPAELIAGRSDNAGRYPRVRSVKLEFELPGEITKVPLSVDLTIVSVSFQPSGTGTKVTIIARAVQIDDATIEDVVEAYQHFPVPVI